MSQALPLQALLLTEGGLEGFDHLSGQDLNLFSEERGFDLVVECTGSPEGLPLALGLLRPRGTLVLKSTVCDKGLLDFSPVVINEITLVGSRCGPFPKALEALVAKKVQVTSLIGEILPLVDGSSAFEKAGRPGSLKIILKNS